MERYRVVEEGAAEGGFGRIDKAEDIELARSVALKHLDPLFSGDLDARDIDRFRREARTLAALSHPNIPAIYDVRFNEDDQKFTIIFEWIEGVTVRDFLTERGTMDLDQVGRWFPQICSALAHAHSAGITHRDVKPSNLIITPNLETCYLVDFGIALRETDLQRLTDSSPVGTAGYMSPEQEEGLEVGSESDVFSLGVVLYECLAGRRPDLGGYRPLTGLNESIPPAFDDVVRDSLADRSVRIADVSTFSHRVSEALRPNPSLPDILANGSLHELRTVLSEMDPNRYGEMTVAQRMLVVSRVRSVIDSGIDHMASAVASLLAELVRLAHRGRTEDYEYVIAKGLHYGFEYPYGEAWHGDTKLRDALNRVALHSDGRAHGTVSDKFLAHLGDDPWSEPRESWYYHSCRILFQNLLANPHCPEDHAERLGEALTAVEELVRRERET